MKIIILAVAIRTILAQENEYHCVWYDQCYFDGQFWKNCAYNGSALPLFGEEIDQDVLNIMLTRCSHILQDENGDLKPLDQVFTCCAKSQLLDMDNSFSLSDTVLGRCSSCTKNYEKHICDYNCLPDQSRFMTAYTEFSEDGIEYVNGLDLYLHSDYMDGAFNSCSGVLVSQTGLPAVNLMCGNAPVCNAEAWFASGGDADSPFVPIPVDFIRSEDNAISLNPSTVPCNSSYEGLLACSCVDCFDSCPVGNEPSPSVSACVILSVNCVSFSIGVTVFVLGVTFFSILTLIDFNKTKTSKIKSENIAEDKLYIGKLLQLMQKIFSKIGVFSSTRPAVVIMLTSWLVIGLIYGAFQLRVTSNPIEIWSAPESQTRKELDYFNTRFGPFYRTAQVFIRVVGRDPFEVTTSSGNLTYGPAFYYDAIQEMIYLEDKILNIGRNDAGVRLEQVCYAPLRQRGGEEDLDGCVVMSAATFFGQSRYTINENNYLNLMQGCINNYLSLECLAPWGGGAEPELVLGGWTNTVFEADTLVMVVPIANHLLATDLEPALEWEKQFLELIQNYESTEKPGFIELAFAAERSIEDELVRTSQAELVPISISYILMFIYVAFSLGKLKSWKNLLVDSKIGVAVASIIIVILSIISALGILGFTGIPITLLAINVIPFFILSVGVDNIFLMVNAIDRITPNLKKYNGYKDTFTYTEKKYFIFSEMMSQVGPSIFVTSASQVVCFGIGIISAAPAVQTFAVFAAISLAFLFLYQMTTSIAVLSLDYDRISDKRIDLFICIKRKSLDESKQPYKSVTQRLIEPFAKVLLKWQTKIIVMIISLAIFSLSIMFIPHIEVGLDQEMSVPVDSYVYRYLNAVNELLTLGPPVYFVLTAGLNFTDPVHQNSVCGGQLCNVDSLATQVFLASLYSDITYISKPSNSWLDDYFDWSALSSCCQYRLNNSSFCESTDTSGDCSSCTIEMDEYGIRPLSMEFNKYIPFFVQDPPTDQCNKGGLASYSLALNYILDNDGLAFVQESHFMAYHTPLSTSKDYYESLRYAREISDNITEAIRQNTGVVDVSVFPYSIAYVYYEQYLTIYTDTALALIYSMSGVLFVVLLMSGFSLFKMFVVFVTVLMILIDMMGLMYIWNIPLNAVSLVNLIISIGIGVEFCSHTLYAYDVSTKPIRERSEDALVKMGSVVINGITFTNIPIIVLAFSVTELIETFFFRMFFGLVLIGVFHGIIFLPVFLSFVSNISSYRR